MICRLEGAELSVEIKDYGVGIPDVEKAMEPLYTTKTGNRPFRNGIYLYGGFYG